MHRVDLFTTIHKGLRAALFSAAQRVARADFLDAGEAAAVAGEFARLAPLLDDHARHETEAIAPELARICPETAGNLRSDHTRLHGLEQEVLRLAARLAGAGDRERLSLGRKLHDRIGPLIADHLRLMEREEVALQRLLWANRSDAELAVVARRFVAGLAPERIAAWLEALLPAVNERERVDLVAGLLERTERTPRAEALPC